MSQLIRRGEATAGAVSKVALASISRGVVVTAVREVGGDLKLIAWQVSADPLAQVTGTTYVTRKGDASAGAVSRVAIATINYSDYDHTVLTAVCDGSGNLKIIAWKVAGDGSAFTRKGEASAGPISDVAIAVLRQDVFVTAVRTTGGDLKLITWNVTDDGVITRQDDATAGAVNKVTVVPAIYKTHHVVTAVETEGGNLKVISWDVSGGGAITRKHDASAGAITEVSTICYPRQALFSDAIVTTAVRGAGKLKLIAWKVSHDAAETVVRLDDVDGDALSEIATASLPVGTADWMVVAGRADNGNLALSVWYWLENAGFIAEGSATAEAISSVAVTNTWDAAGVVTAVRDGNDNLKVIAWELVVS